MDGSTCSESLPEENGHFDTPEHVPQTSARAQTSARGLGGLAECHGAESTRNDTRPGEKKCRKAKKTHVYIVIQGSLLGCVLREFSGVTQVEQGQEGNTAVAAAYLCWVKHCRRSSRTGVPADYCY